jgi:hypothetical protein
MSPDIAGAAEAIKFESVVLLLVVAGLFVLAKIVSDLRAEIHKLRGGTTATESAAAPAQALPAPAAASPAEAIPADVYTAIVAAVYATLGVQHRIISVNPSESMMWSREGRRSIFRSHSFR